MYAPRFDMELVHFIKEVLLKIKNNQRNKSLEKELLQRLETVEDSEILLIVYEMCSSDYGITTQDVEKFLELFQKVFNYSLSSITINLPSSHPVQIFRRENQAFQKALNNVKELMENISTDKQLLTCQDSIRNLLQQMERLGQIINHFNRKEKLFFPILERYGQYSITRLMWGDDDRIRNLYKGTKEMVQRLPSLDFQYVNQTFKLFKHYAKEMIYQEEIFLLPVLLATFDEKDWQAIASESDAYGYAFIDPVAIKSGNQGKPHIDEELANKQIPFGGGYLTIKEADAILNNLPVEITFVDKFGVFKYFNDRVKASDMMFIRTPSSIGRNVGNCHPPKSMKKVTQLIRDLQLRRREYECMWFKKDGRYVHITYKGLFDEDGEFLGILEYVQDIQPFLQLPREVKKELSPLPEEKVT